MKVTIFAEGCYPYVFGGVSSWLHMLISKFSDIEFELQTIIVNQKQKGNFVYNLPKNVVNVREAFLYDDDIVYGKTKTRFNEQERKAMMQLIDESMSVEWSQIFSLFSRHENLSINDMLMGRDFLDIVCEYYEKKYSHIIFSDFLWTMRSLYLPLCLLLKNKPGESDLFHSVSTGYAGVLASYAKFLHKDKPLLITEHGIYTREREEEIIQSDWARGVNKDIWISNFYKQSYCAYEYADKVIALFEDARNLQIEMGCDAKKTMVISNGVDIGSFSFILPKPKEDKNINVGAILRVVPIKDVKTLIDSFHQAVSVVPNLKLYIMGPTDENPQYYEDCVHLVEDLMLTDKVIFTGKVSVIDYIGRMDMIVLTSVSESQPLALLEAMAAKKPCIATNVGSCREILFGRENDTLGEAGIITPIMKVSEIASAIVRLANNPLLRQQMGQIGYRRIINYYQQSKMIKEYTKLYQLGEMKNGGNRI